MLPPTYLLDEERIARHPLPDRAAARMLVYRPGAGNAPAGRAIADHRVSDLPGQLPAGSLLVANETRVIPARLPMLTRTGQPVELLLHEPIDPPSHERALAAQGTGVWEAMVGGRRKWRAEAIHLDADLPFVLRALWQDRERNLVRLEWEPADMPLSEVLDRAGRLPLPPYLRRPAGRADQERYQTVFARQPGAVAAPTAGLHLTDGILAGLAEAGHQIDYLTLHVGLGTFLPVTAERLEDHPMHAERYQAPRSLVERIIAHGAGPVVAVGTTSLRTLETLYWRGAALLAGQADPTHLSQTLPYEIMDGGRPMPTRTEALRALCERNAGQTDFIGQTQLFIHPPYRARTIEAILTNFHQPGSTLLALVESLIGPAWRQVYDHALATGYRFLSYGDSSLLYVEGARDSPRP